MEKSLRQKKLEEEADTQSEVLLRGKIFDVRKDTFEIEGFKPYEWYVVEHPGAVAIIPVNEKGNILLIQQWRRAVEKILYELPAGCLDEGEEPQACGERELQEEIDFKAKTWIPLSSFYAAPGYSDEYLYLFIAKDLEESSLPGDDHEAIDVIEMSLEEALNLIDEGKIEDAKTIAGLLQYDRWCKKHA